MERALRNFGKMARVVEAATTAVVLVLILAGMASANKKQKVYLPNYVLNAKTVLVVILPDSAEPMDDPSANRKAQEEVEKAFLKWGRYRLALDTSTADLVIAVRKGTEKVANPTINGGGVDSPGTVETTDNQVRVVVQQGRNPDTTQQGPSPVTNGPNGRAYPGVEVGPADDTFMVFRGGGVPYPLDNAPVWKHIAKDGLKPPGVAAVEQFRKAVEESEKAAAQKQQQQQKKNP